MSEAKENEEQPIEAAQPDVELTDAVLEQEPVSGERPADGSKDGRGDVEKLVAEKDELLSLLQHTKAEFSNYQRRIQKELEVQRKYATFGLAADLIEVVDNLERAIDAAKSTNEFEGLLDGIRMVHQQFNDVLSRNGIKPIAAVGLAFDPNVHEAVLEQPSETKPPGTVVNELQKGYQLHDRVLRATKVMVSKAVAADGDGEDSDSSKDQDSGAPEGGD